MARSFFNFGIEAWGLFLISHLLATATSAAFAQQRPEPRFGREIDKKVVLKERSPELEGYGENYDLGKYDECRKQKGRQDTVCEIYRLKRVEAPETWPFHKSSPIKWPDPPKEQVYKPGMGPVEYWRALCKAEAGEFIYKTVPNVTSIYQIRPRPKEPEYSGGDRFVREDPYGYIEGESGTLEGVIWKAVGPGFTTRKSPGGYSVLETPVLRNTIHKTQEKYFSSMLFQQNGAELLFQKFWGYNGRYNEMQMKYVSGIDSRYGWTWRAIKRPLDRVVGVAGGELAVVDLKTGEILGLRRGFVLGALTLGGKVGWGSGNTCPEYSLMPGIGSVRKRNKDFDFSFWFINKVLIPEGAYRD